MDGTHRHREGAHPSSPNYSNFQLCTAFPIITMHRGDPWMADSATAEMPTHPSTNQLS